MHDAHFMDPYPIPPRGPEDPPADDAAGDEGVAPVGRGRRVPRRRGCETGGHINSVRVLGDRRPFLERLKQRTWINRVGKQNRADSTHMRGRARICVRHQDKPT
ncbi:hypothetical protein PIB30_113963, partial [Stylosanthes scabra]|nr:hypothetical protein [Stylosanthes scabra]